MGKLWEISDAREWYTIEKYLGVRRLGYLFSTVGVFAAAGTFAAALLLESGPLGGIGAVIAALTLVMTGVVHAYNEESYNASRLARSERQSEEGHL